MKQNGIVNNGKSSERKSRSIAMQNLMQRVVAIMVLAFVCGDVWAGDYVFYNGTVYMAINNSGTLVTSTSFDPTTCIWSGTSGGKFYCNGHWLGQNSSYVPIADGPSYYNTTINTSGYIVDGSKWYYNYNSGAFSTTSSLKTYSFKAYEIETVDAVLPTLTISSPASDGSSYIGSVGGTMTISANMSGGYHPKYHKFNNSYYLEDGTYYGTTPPSTTNNHNLTYELVGECVNYATISDHTVTYTADAGHDVEAQVKVTAKPQGYNIVVGEGTCSFVLRSATIAVPTISRSGNNVTLATTSIGATIYYTTDGTIPTSSSTTYTSVIDLTSLTLPVTIKAIAIRNGNSSSVSSDTYESLMCVQPVISIAPNGAVTITAESGTIIYYTTNGDTPTASETTTNKKYTASFNVISETTVKAIAVKDGYDNSAVASAVYLVSGITSGGKVILNDYEDHNWTYYQKSDNLPSGYPTDDLTSPDPRNVKITYQGGGVDGASAVAISGLSGEGQNTMIYYKTLEKHDLSVKDDGEYAYTVISNPFSKRPRTTGATGTNGYYGFAGWKVISGGEYIAEHANNDVLSLDETIHFTNLDNGYTPNCTSAEVVFEATWTTATVKTGKTVQSFSGGTYETNFWVINDNSTGGTVNSPCTVTMMTPDGGATNNYRGSYTLSGVITPGTNGVKVEFVRMNTTTAVSAAGYNYTLGRGIISTASNTNTGGVLSGSNSNTDCDNVVKVESGVYSQIFNFRSDIDANKKCNQLMILGCDYDRAKNDNTKLIVKQHVIAGNNVYLNRTPQDIYIRYVVKSGNLWANQAVKGDDAYTGGINQNFYISCGGYHQAGRRFLLMEGGRVSGIAGGQNDEASEKPTDKAVDMRIRGTTQIDGNVYGAAEYAGARGIRTLVFTGGTINGWIAGGANGTQSTGGLLTGSTYVYVGGNTTVKSDASYPNQVMNRAVGGNVFGAGCGYSATSTSGKVTLGTNVVVSDGAYIERGVYGGGSYGFSANDKTSSLFILGGQIAGKPGGVDGESYDATVQGGVYGGACQNIGGSANIYMDGGLVETGLYGGSNKTGTLSGNVKIQVDGGQIGTTSSTANIHGGGYGQPTVVSGNVDITLGKTGSEADADGVTVYGDVYGGSALGSVNGTNAADTYHTNVTLNSGTIHGSLYGGALGSKDVAANVYGPVAVKVYGGSVQTTDGTGANGSGAVYGCNNINGKPQRAVTVDIYGTNSHDAGSKATDPSDDKYAIYAVYGGGNQAAYTFGTPAVTIHNCNNSIEYVYGGGNQATVPGTKVDVYGGNIIGTVFGGGNNANVTTNGTDVNIYGGRILNVYGGNNNGGAITGSIKVDVAEPATVTCPVNIDDLYGGGNMAASNAGTITIGKCTNINRVFGGANQANVTGPINLSIVNGNIGTVFGGNNNSGTITGAINVTVNWDGTGNRSLGSVYGGGNLAEYKGSPTVNILNCTTTGSIFGGGLGVVKDADGKITKGAFVVGNPTVNIGDWVEGHSVIIGGNVFGGGDLAAVEGDPKVTVNDCGTLIKGDLYGGGNAAPVYSTNLTMWGGTVMGNVFGGGNGKDLTKNENGAQIGYKRDDSATGGTGNAVAKIFGGTVGTWNGDECTAGGGIFGGSNTKGNVRGEVQLTIDQQKCSDAPKACDLKVKEIYGAGNEAAFAGTGINFNLGCVSALSEIYGGAKKANLSGDVHLVISSGHFNKVFAGNNLGGNIDGSIKVTIEETGCNPVIIDELYGGGNMAAYTTPSGKAQPEVEVISCTHIGQVFGGGYGKSAVVTGNPIVNINQIPGKFDPDKAMATPQVKQEQTIATGKLGTIGTVFGGGNAANVVGNTNVNIGTKTTVTLSSGDSTYKNQTFDVKGVNITGNVYGGGNAADVTGKTNVTVGK